MTYLMLNLHEEAVTAKIWSQLPQELINKMVKSAVNHIELAELEEGNNQETEGVLLQ